VRQAGRLRAVEVPGHAPLRRPTVDRQERDVDRPGTHGVREPVVENRVAAVEHREATEADDVAELPAAARRVALHGLVGRRDRVQLHAARPDGPALVEAERPVDVDPEPLGDEGAGGLRDHQRRLGVAAQHGTERLGVEVVGVGVARRDDVDAVEERRVDDALAQAHVRAVRGGVLPGQRVGEVRVEEHPPPRCGQQEAALAEPPQVERPRLLTLRAVDVGDQGGVGEDRSDHSPSSARTTATPAHRFCSLARAAQRAVWLRPQSGANDSLPPGPAPRSAGPGGRSPRPARRSSS
jgi:hypothetical protein